MTNEEIVDTLNEMLSELCKGCSGCKSRCLDYQVLEYLIKEKGENKPLNWLDRCDDHHLSDN